MRLVRHAVAALLLCLGFATAANAQEIRCQSRNFQYQHCPSNGEVIDATLVRQESQAACIRGRTWGWNSNGVWVSNGCSGRFRVQTFQPLPPCRAATGCAARAADSATNSARCRSACSTCN